jgi:glycosyltransferase involved in cell wall biosynthesis
MGQNLPSQVEPEFEPPEMRVLFMADVPASPDSGAAGTEYQTIEALRRLNHEVDTIWSDALPHRIAHGNLHYLLELPLAYERAMKRRLRGGKYDVVHVNQPHGYLAAKALACSESGAIFIHRSHGVEPRVERDLRHWLNLYQTDRRFAARKIISKGVSVALAYHNKGIARYADGHIVSASQCRDFLHQEMGVPLERIAVIPQAPPSLFLEQPALAMTAERIRRLLYVGQFAFFKAPMIVAAVFNELMERGDGPGLTWVCSREHHPQVRALLSEAANQRITLLDWMPQHQLIRVYDEHGILLFPSFFEGFGKAFLEAMSRGLCIVAADNGGARDTIRHGVNGMLAPTGCADTIIEYCDGLMADESRAAKISQAAADTARAFTWDRVAAETVAFYKDRLAAKSRRGY